MRSSILSAVALSAQITTAYLNTSPLFMFSTSSQLESHHTTHILPALEVTEDIANLLSTCPTKHYLLISQAGVTTASYKDPKAVRTLASKLQNTDNKIKSTTIISEVLGNLDTQKIKQALEKCKVSTIKLDATDKSIHDHTEPTLFEIALPKVSQAFPDFALHENDAYLAWLLDMLAEQDYTVVYTTSIPTGDVISSEPGTYEMQDPFFDIPHTELRRDVSAHKRKKNNQTDDAPLFEKYQFFTPGIWMGFSATFLLLAILYVGVNALASLQVTYAAFEKESGPSSNKKAQ